MVTWGSEFSWVPILLAAFLPAFAEAGISIISGYMVNRYPQNLLQAATQAVRSNRTHRPTHPYYIAAIRPKRGDIHAYTSFELDPHNLLLISRCRAGDRRFPSQPRCIHRIQPAGVRRVLSQRGRLERLGRSIAHS